MENQGLSQLAVVVGNLNQSISINCNCLSILHHNWDKMVRAFWGKMLRMRLYVSTCTTQHFRYLLERKMLKNRG